MLYAAIESGMYCKTYQKEHLRLCSEVEGNVLSIPSLKRVGDINVQKVFKLGKTRKYALAQHIF